MNTLGFGDAIATCFRKYIVTAGRARRSEYWWFVLFVISALLLAIVADMILWPYSFSQVTSLGPLGTVVMLATVLPLLAVGARRMHDTDRSAWWLVVQLVPAIGGLVFAFLAVGRGTVGVNRYGSAAEAVRDTSGAHPSQYTRM